MSSLLTAYWRDRETVVNIGDYATAVLLELFGHSFVGPSAPNAKSFEMCHLLCGTLLTSSWFRKLHQWDLHVWGSGSAGEWPISHNGQKVAYHAVRGPRTARVIGHPNLPQGDPALLLPYLLHFDPVPGKSDSIFVPHFLSLALPSSLPRGFDAMASSSCHREQWITRIKRIATAGFVASGSLHGCIFAHAYGRPWSPFLRRNECLNMPEKWKDWFEYIGIEPDVNIPSSISAAEDWWLRYGAGADRPSLRPLILSLPFEVLNEAARQKLDTVP